MTVDWSSHITTANASTILFLLSSVFAFCPSAALNQLERECGSDQSLRRDWLDHCVVFCGGFTRIAATLKTGRHSISSRLVAGENPLREFPRQTAASVYLARCHSDKERSEIGLCAILEMFILRG
jgi:hypothetical protein